MIDFERTINDFKSINNLNICIMIVIIIVTLSTWYQNQRTGDTGQKKVEYLFVMYTNVVHTLTFVSL